MPVSAIASKRPRLVTGISPYVCDSCLAALLRRRPISHLGVGHKPEESRRLRLRTSIVLKRFTTTTAASDPQDHGRGVSGNKGLEAHTPHAAANKVAKGRRHSVKNKRLSSDVSGIQRATRIVRDISEQKTLEDEDYKRLVSVLYDRRNSHAVQQAHIRSTTQKLRQSAAATAVLAQFRSLKTTLKVSNRNLLSELLDSDRCDDATASTMKKRDHHVVEDSKMERSLADGWSENDGNMLHTDAQSDFWPEMLNRDADLSDPEQTIYGIEDVAIPPVLKPRAMQSRRGVSKEVAPRVREMSGLERALHCNSYAHALSSSLRQCSVTGLRQPASLFVGFGLLLDTSSGLPWMVPDGTQIEKLERGFIESGEDSPFSLKAFPTRVLSKSDTIQEVGGPVITDADSESVPLSRSEATSAKPESFAGSLEAQNANSQLNSPVSMAQKPRAVRISGMKAYSIRSRSALSWITDNAARMSRSIPVGWRLELKNATRDLIVRQNMDGYVTKLLQYKVARHLAWLATQKGDCVLQRFGHVVTQGSGHQTEATVSVPQSFHTTDDVRGVTAMLALNDALATGQACFSRSQPCESAKDIPSDPFAHTVAVYNLPQLLGSDAFSWLQTGVEAVEPNIFNENVVAIRKDPRTVKTLILLWNLRQYLHLEGSTTTDILLKSAEETDPI